MSFINPRTKQINLKIVYFGPVFAGKSTTLRNIAKQLAKKSGAWAAVSDSEGRTAFFDFLPLSLGRHQGQRIHLHLYAVPGPILYKANRRLLFKGIDGIIFVADSRITRLEENLLCLQDLEENLRDQDIFYEELPVVFQYNKRDLADAIAPLRTLNEVLNPDQRPSFETVADRGTGILEPLQFITKQSLKELHYPE
jgi:hypothetical protein